MAIGARPTGSRPTGDIGRGGVTYNESISIDCLTELDQARSAACNQDLDLECLSELDKAGIIAANRTADLDVDLEQGTTSILAAVASIELDVVQALVIARSAHLAANCALSHSCECNTTIGNEFLESISLGGTAELNVARTASLAAAMAASISSELVPTPFATLLEAIASDVSGHLLPDAQLDVQKSTACQADLDANHTCTTAAGRTCDLDVAVDCADNNVLDAYNAVQVGADLGLAIAGKTDAHNAVVIECSQEVICSLGNSVDVLVGMAIAAGYTLSPELSASGSIVLANRNTINLTNQAVLTLSVSLGAELNLLKSRLAAISGQIEESVELVLTPALSGDFVGIADIEAALTQNIATLVTAGNAVQVDLAPLIAVSGSLSTMRDITLGASGSLAAARTIASIREAQLEQAIEAILVGRLSHHNDASMQADLDQALQNILTSEPVADFTTTPSALLETQVDVFDDIALEAVLAAIISGAKTTTAIQGRHALRGEKHIEALLGRQLLQSLRGKTITGTLRGERITVRVGAGGKISVSIKAKP